MSSKRPLERGDAHRQRETLTEKAGSYGNLFSLYSGKVQGTGTIKPRGASTIQAGTVRSPGKSVGT